MNNSYNGQAKAAELEGRQRRRVIRWLRFCANIKRPWIILTSIVILLSGYAARLIRIPFPSMNTYPMLVTFWDYTVTLFIVLFSVVLVFGLVTSAPAHAKKIEADFTHIGLIDRYGYAPALVSCCRIKGTSIKRLSFYSKGVSKDAWEEGQADIEDCMDVHLLEPPQYGKRRTQIVLVVAPGVPVPRKEAVYDDEL